MGYFFGGEGNPNRTEQNVSVQHEKQQTRPERARRQYKDYEEQLQDTIIYPGYKSWWHRPFSYVIIGFAVFIALVALYRVFGVDEYEKTTGDWILTYALYSLIASVFFSAAGWGISLVVKEARKHWQDARIFILPNGLPAMYEEIKRGFKAQDILSRTGYYDVLNTQAQRDLVAPAELHISVAPQHTYAPSNTKGDAPDQSAQQELLEGLLSDRLGAEEEKRDWKPLPKLVNLFDALDYREPGHIILGVNEDNEFVQIPIEQLFHHLVAGRSGSGKSVYLRGLVYQLLREAEENNRELLIALADIENNTFPEFKDCKYVRWYASNDIEVEQLTLALLTEVDRRKKLYESLGRATPKTLDRYNIIARRENKPLLPMIVAFYDEFSAFMADAKSERKRVAGSVLSLALRARKYGIFLVISGQSFKSDFVDSSITGQFGFTTAFKLRTNMQSLSVLGQTGAENLTQDGEALIKTKSGEIIRLQTPYADDDELIEALEAFYTNDKPRADIPDLVKEIVAYSHCKLDDKVLFRNVEKYLRERGVSRGDFIRNAEWMDEHGFVRRNEKNGRVLNWDVIRQFGMREEDCMCSLYDEEEGASTPVDE